MLEELRDVFGERIVMGCGLFWGYWGQGMMAVLGTVWCAAEGRWMVVSYVEERVGWNDRDVLEYSR